MLAGVKLGKKCVTTKKGERLEMAKNLDLAECQAYF